MLEQQCEAFLAFLLALLVCYTTLAAILRSRSFATLPFGTPCLLVPSEASMKVRSLQTPAIACSTTVIEDYESARTSRVEQHHPRVAAVENGRTCRHGC